jgi:hypothetical protein
MKKLSLGQATINELVDRFVQLCLEQDRYIARDEIAKVNRLFDKIEAVKDELKSRAGDQRSALFALYDHPNMQVRVKAAKATLALNMTAARAKLEEIRAENWQPQSADAGMCLWALDQGIFKPT